LSSNLASVAPSRRNSLKYPPLELGLSANRICLQCIAPHRSHKSDIGHNLLVAEFSKHIEVLQRCARHAIVADPVEVDYTRNPKYIQRPDELCERHDAAKENSRH